MQKELEELEAQYQKDYTAWIKKIQATKDPKERTKLFSENPSRSYGAKFLAFAKQAPQSEPAAKALAWVVQRAVGKDQSEAIALMKKHHLLSKSIGDVALRLAYSMEKSTEEFLRELLKKNPNREVKAKATYSLAVYLQRANRGKATKEVEKLYETLAKEYGDLERFNRSYKKIAEAALREIRLLGIGKVAPDIKGEDVDGTKFKLSDYRGKVVVIDFWGDW